MYPVLQCDDSTQCARSTCQDVAVRDEAVVLQPLHKRPQLLRCY